MEFFVGPGILSPKNIEFSSVILFGNYHVTPQHIYSQHIAGIKNNLICLITSI